tara:strand:+ start:2675 stop:3757 length:1083 start_codon:yes stop_codon:yes gene_type:complete
MRIKHVSASQITTYQDCPRKWYLNKIAGLETPSTSATQLGGEVHELLENYLRHGVDIPADTDAGAIALSGIKHLPTTRPIEVELSLADDMPLNDSPVLVRGFVDLIVPSEHHIIDHKTSSNKRYTKTKRELRQNVQLILYARAYLDRAPDCDEVTLTHIYYGTKSRWSKRVTVSLTRDEILNQWASIRQVITEMMETSTHDHAGDAAPNYDACKKYGGCPFVSECFNAARYPAIDGEPQMTPEQRMQKLGLSEPKPTPIQPKPTTANTKILYIGCHPVKNGTRPLNVLDAYREEVDAICKAFNVPHIGVIDYGKGYSALTASIADRGWVGEALYLEMMSKEYEYLVSLMSSLADVVIKRG